MRHAGLIILACFALTVCLTPIADAQLSAEYAAWPDGPEGFLLTKKEKKEWAKISTDADAERFITLFWARRNPEPANPQNSFREEFEAKVRFADENFSYGNHRGLPAPRPARPGLSRTTPRRGITTRLICRRDSRRREPSSTSSSMRSASIPTPSSSIEPTANRSRR